MNRVIRTAILAGVFTLSSATVYAQNLRFSGFGDFVFGANGGGKADTAAAERFGTFGSDVDPVNTNRGFGLTGTDFVVLADMTDNATFLGEINLQTGRGGSSDLELDVERFFVNYRIDQRFNVQAGLFFMRQAFKTPSLRNVALTAPYQHDGSEVSLTEVVTFYNRGGRDPQSYGKSLDIRPLTLTDGDVHDVVAFLEALTGETDARLRPQAPARQVQ